ncbi:cytochrome b/b6 domain-containing protein [Bartonella sp. LJL80]
MSVQATNSRLYGYNSGAMILHWLIALLIIVQLAMGFAMERVPQIADSLRFSMIQWHKTFGLLVLALTLARIAWRLMNKPPAHAPMLKIEALTANAVAALFYILMLMVPITGWIVVSTSPTAIPTLFFKISGLVWPNLPLNKSAVIEHYAAYTHMILAYSFVVLLGLHVGGALKHMVIDHVPELQRMVPTRTLPRKPVGRGSVLASWAIVIIFLGVGLGIGQLMIRPNQPDHSVQHAAPMTAGFTPNWAIDKQTSTLSYHLDFSGTSKPGKIGNWDANIRFDPTNLGDARAEISIRSASISYDDSYVSGSIKEADGLDIAQNPLIKVILTEFKHLHDNAYSATATITIRGVEVTVDVPFTFIETDGVAHVTGNADLERLAFGIGKQNDASGQWLGKTIHVEFDVKAKAL